MKEARGDIFDHINTADAICITTNGFVKKASGECVMGGGCAKQAAQRWPRLPKAVGLHLKVKGNNVGTFKNPDVHALIVSFPVKTESWVYEEPNQVVKHMRGKFKLGDTVPGWACVASPELIKRSAIQLAALADSRGFTNVILPRPGAGLGELQWSDVKPILEQHLDDRFTCMTY